MASFRTSAAPRPAPAIPVEPERKAGSRRPPPSTKAKDFDLTMVVRHGNREGIVVAMNDDWKAGAKNYVMVNYQGECVNYYPGELSQLERLTEKRPRDPYY